MNTNFLIYLLRLTHQQAQRAIHSPNTPPDTEKCKLTVTGSTFGNYVIFSFSWKKSKSKVGLLQQLNTAAVKAREGDRNVRVLEGLHIWKAECWLPQEWCANPENSFFSGHNTSLPLDWRRKKTSIGRWHPGIYSGTNTGAGKSPWKTNTWIVLSICFKNMMSFRFESQRTKKEKDCKNTCERREIGTKAEGACLIFYAFFSTDPCLISTYLL